MKRKMSMTLAMVLAVSMIFGMHPMTSNASSGSLMEEKETELFTENETVIEDEEEVPKAESIEEKTTEEETTERHGMRYPLENLKSICKKVSTQY